MKKINGSFLFSMGLLVLAGSYCSLTLFAQILPNSRCVRVSSTVDCSLVGTVMCAANGINSLGDTCDSCASDTELTEAFCVNVEGYMCTRKSSVPCGPAPRYRGVCSFANPEGTAYTCYNPKRVGDCYNNTVAVICE